jgi:hypothetical protein
LKQDGSSKKDLHVWIILEHEGKSIDILSEETYIHLFKESISSAIAPPDAPTTI